MPDAYCTVSIVVKRSRAVSRHRILKSWLDPRGSFDMTGGGTQCVTCNELTISAAWSGADCHNQSSCCRHRRASYSYSIVTPISALHYTTNAQLIEIDPADFFRLESTFYRRLIATSIAYSVCAPSGLGGVVE